MSTGDGGRRAWLVLLVAAGVYAALLAAVVAVRGESSTDFRDFWENAVRFRESGQIAADLGVHNYLPFFTIFMLPWGFLPLPAAVVLFTLLSLALFAVAVLLVEELLADGLPTRPRAPLLISLGLMLPYVHSCAVLGNVGLLLVFLLVGAWFLVERGREWPAGVALGLAALIKLLPIVLVMFFVLKRRWRVVGAAAGTIFLLGLGLPLATIGWAETAAQHRAYYDRAVREGSAVATILSDRPLKASYSNNAVPIVLRRLLSPVDGGKEETGTPLLVNVVNCPRSVILGVYGALLAVFLIGSVGAAIGKPRPWPPASIADGAALRAQFGVWCCLMLLVSPLVWTHYLPLACWPLTWLVDRVARTRREAGRIDRVGAMALGVWLLGAVALVWPAARAAGAQIASVLALWVALIVLCLRRRE